MCIHTYRHKYTFTKCVYVKKKKQTVMVPSSHSFCIQVGRLCFFSLTDVILLLKSLFAEKQPGGCHH